MLKAIHAQEDKAAAMEKAKAVEEKLRGMKLSKAADKVRDSIQETLTYMGLSTVRSNEEPKWSELSPMANQL